MNKVNFFWCGPNFNFLEFMVLKSHLKVEHSITLWIHGDHPTNKYWKEIFPMITTKNADEIFDISEFLTNGGSFRTAADLWRFYFLYKEGGLYCDTDAFALRKFPDDEWIVCSAETIPSMLSIGVLKSPAGHPMFLECINSIKNNWGNIQVFTNVYRKYFGNTNPTHKNELFYPYKWKEYRKIIMNVQIPKDVYSIHFYSNALERYLLKPETFLLRHLFLIRKLNIQDLNIQWCMNNDNTLLGRLWLWLTAEEN